MFQSIAADSEIRVTDPVLLTLARATGTALPLLNPTPHEVVFTENRSRLLRFSPDGRPAGAVFISYAMINRFYILDLMAGRSVAEYLTRKGLLVYLLDWGVTCPDDRLLSMEHYVDGILVRALRAARVDRGADRIPIAGYCQGGTLAAIVAALHPEMISALVTVAAPFDFSTVSEMSKWTAAGVFDVDAVTAANGNVPGAMIQGGFLALQPMVGPRKWMKVAKMAGDPQALAEFMALETWASDGVPFPGGFYRKYIRDFYQENRLKAGTFVLGGRPVDLRKIRCPVLVVSASEDPIVSRESSEALLGLVGSERKETLVAKAGHIGIAVSSRTFEDVWGRIAEFVLEAGGGR